MRVDHCQVAQFFEDRTVGDGQDFHGVLTCTRSEVCVVIFLAEHNVTSRSAVLNCGLTECSITQGKACRWNRYLLRAGGRRAAAGLASPRPLLRLLSHRAAQQVEWSNNKWKLSSGTCAAEIERGLNHLPCCLQLPMSQTMRTSNTTLRRLQANVRFMFCIYSRTFCLRTNTILCSNSGKLPQHYLSVSYLQSSPQKQVLDIRANTALKKISF